MFRTKSILLIQQKIIGFFLMFSLLAGCANYGHPRNLEITGTSAADRYSLGDWEEGESASNLSLVLTFSGGGTRAAALS